MENARGQKVSVSIQVKDGVFTASGKSYNFYGFRRAYVEGSDNPLQVLAEREKLLPPLKKNDTVNLDLLQSDGHRTKPPARLTEASLVRVLEQKGIGRPSTYASIIDTILGRELCL